MQDLGDPISYKVVERHTPVLSADGEEIGTVDHVLADEQTDVFDGIVIRRPVGKPQRHCFADADEVESIHERGVTLKLAAQEAENLPEPGANPAVLHEAGEGKESALAHKLRRAWDWVSGNY